MIPGKLFSQSLLNPLHFVVILVMFEAQQVEKTMDDQGLYLNRESVPSSCGLTVRGIDGYQNIPQVGFPIGGKRAVGERENICWMISPQVLPVELGHLLIREKHDAQAIAPIKLSKNLPGKAPKLIEIEHFSGAIANVNAHT